MKKYFVASLALVGLIVTVPVYAQSYANTSGLYRNNPNHVLSLPYQRFQREEATLQNYGSGIYDDGHVRVQDNTRRNTTEFQRNRSITGTATITRGRVTPSNHRRIRNTRYPHTPYTTQPYRRQKSVLLPRDEHCDWVTHFERYHDGIGWVDTERVVRECDEADAYIRYYGRDGIGRGRYTPNSFNQYDSYYKSDGVQRFNTYGW